MNFTIQSQDNDKIQLLFKGKNVNNVTVNTLRRIILAEVPTYSLIHDNIQIEKNTSIFNNDYVRQRMCFIPLPDIQNNVTLLHKNEDLEQDTIDVYVEKQNNTTSEMHVTTDDMKCYINGELKPRKYDHPLLLIKLRPTEIIKLHGKAVIGKPKNNQCWSAVGPCYYEMINNDEYLMTIVTLKQLTFKEIFEKACRIIIEKLDDIRITVGDNYKNVKDGITIKLEGENHTMGNLITHILQGQKGVIASYAQPHLLIEEIQLNICADKPMDAFFEAIDLGKKIYEKTLKNSNILLS